MAKDDPLKWEVEPPENFLVSHFLFRGVHQILWKNWPDINIIQPNFYITKSAEEGLSVDWSKYATPQFTLKHLLIPNLRVNGTHFLNKSILYSFIKIIKDVVTYINIFKGVKRPPKAM